METVKLAFEKFGAVENSPLIILHGFFASARNWRQIAEKLAEDFCVYVLDARNHGNSPHHPDMNYTVMAEDVARFIRHNQLFNVTLLGHSMGGKTAMWLALTAPELLENLIIVDIAPVSYTHSFDYLINQLKTLSLPDLKNRKQAEVFLAQTIPDLEYRQFLLQNLLLTPDGYAWRIDLDIFLSQADHVVQFPDSNHLKPFNKKTLFIAGELSTYIPQNSIQKLFPFSENIVIQKAQHWVHVQQPQLFLQAVQHFLIKK